MTAKAMVKALRCAIYTRVSTDAGLEQDFNSLDAQREASEAYIKSQAHEGWKLIRDHYDDGGFSGGSMERPALQKLLDDVRARKVDVIVVYKVDRLTRSLADFAKLVELFDQHQVSFVSVTQSFNTTTSMGRLTLNVLLSFAQFEREVTGERIRDKIAASKKKGIWMGGVVPLGYRVESRALHIVEEHAVLVRSLFDRYLALGSVVRLKAALDADGIRVPVRIDGAGRTTGGGLFSRGHLYQLLANPIYVGRLGHKGQVHDGQQEAIVDLAIWQRVQQQFAAQTQQRSKPSPNTEAILTGKIYDDRGERMTPTWASKRGRRWRYYVSQALLKGRGQDAGSVPRVPAAEIERIVLEAASKAMSHKGGRPSKAGTMSSYLEGDPSDNGFIGQIDRVVVTRGSVSITLAQAEADGAPAIITVAWTPLSPVRRREIVGATAARADQRPMRDDARKNLLVALSDAHRWLDELITRPGATTDSIAQREGKAERSIRRTMSLAFLAPDIATAAVKGRLARGFNLTRLLDLPDAWDDQRRQLGLQPGAF